MAEPGRYLYAVVAADPGLDLGPIGLDGGRVYAVPAGPLAAVVSAVPNRKVRPERKKLAAHNAVLKRLLADRPLLPMAFGLIADGDAEVCRLLERNADRLAAQLDRVAGHVEMGLRVRLAADNPFDHYVRATPELRQLRDELFAGGATPRPDDLVELGRAFERALSDRRRDAAELVLAAVGPACSEAKETRLRTEGELLNLACLVPAGRVPQYEAAVAAAAERFGDDVVFDLSGPWPPHNFVDAGLVAADDEDDDDGDEG